MAAFDTITYAPDPALPGVARLTLDRPDRLNAISFAMPGEIRRAVQLAEADPAVHVVVVQGAGRAFCAGYDLQDTAQNPEADHPRQQESVPPDGLDAATDALATRIAGVPASHLAMHKLVVNQVMLTMGLEQSQMLATVFDGIARHNPEGLWFRRYAQVNGFKEAVRWRDSGRPIPEGDDARARILELERQLREARGG